jgi:predicted AlkP superfamily pyrophosphatase or phosphodiesterase
MPRIFDKSPEIFSGERKVENSDRQKHHVIWIGSDGFGSHYTDWSELPNLTKMRDAGSWTLHMRSVLPSASALNWETMLVGAPSEMHGFRTWGSKEPDVEPIYRNEHGRYPDIFRVVKDQMPDAKTACAYDWDGIGYLYDKSCVDDDVLCDSGEKVLEAALKQLEAKPTFAFFYFGEVDVAGHGYGWGSPEYHAAVVKTDEYVGKIFEKLNELGMTEENTVVYFTSDHGGSDKGHGDARLDHMEVPFIIWGRGIETGEITDVVVNFDCAPNAAWLFGLERPQAWRGMPVYSATEKK